MLRLHIKLEAVDRQLRVVLDKDKLASSGLDFLSVSEMIKANNAQLNSGSFDKNDREFLVTTGTFLDICQRCGKFSGGCATKSTHLFEASGKDRRWSGSATKLCKSGIWTGQQKSV